jgi:maltooligosyltrehalose trehalohydrolase
VEFRVWAPAADTVAVRLADGEHELVPRHDGVFAGTVEAPADGTYVYVLDGDRALPDPCSRAQPLGARGPSEIVDTSAFRWTDEAWQGLVLGDLVVYELHVGTFSASGTFDGVAARLPELRDLGVTAIELMPVGTFPGRRSWGYDGLYAWAPHEAYGGPAGLARLVDEAHRQGIGVILDVVYNHLGPGAEALTSFGPYIAAGAPTPWGGALDHRMRGVREWAIQSGELWIRDYHVDGLRLDATQAIVDDSGTHVLAELARRARAIDPRALVTAEAETGDTRPLLEWGLDAQWADEFHHVLHVLLTGEREGSYAGYRASVGDLAAQLARTPPQRLIVCSQNHDQVGNRPHGDRPRPAELRLRAAALLFAPQTPLLFMGEEYGEQRPFPFFADHDDPAVRAATRQGRRREVARLSGGDVQDLLDPYDPETFARAVLRPEQGDAELTALYRRLLALRRELPHELGVEADEARRLLRLRRGRAELLLNFSGCEQDGVPPRGMELRASA